MAPPAGERWGVWISGPGMTSWSLVRAPHGGAEMVYRDRVEAESTAAVLQEQRPHHTVRVFGVDRDGQRISE